MNNPTGKTKDSGYQVGARKTMAADHQKLREFLFSNAGMSIWLGDPVGGEPEPGKLLTLNDGTEIRVTVFNPSSHIRMTWKKPGWDQNSRLQLRVIKSKEKSVVAFHQEMLQNAGQRAQMKIHWNKVLDQISREF